MRAFFGHLRANAVMYAVNLLSFSVGIFFYYRLIGAFATLLLAGILALYVLCMAICRYAQNCYRRRERESALNARNSFLYALGICAPIYWCWVIVGMIPVFSFYGFLITALPAHIVAWIPLKATADLVDTKGLFWGTQILISALTLCFCRLLYACFL